MAARYPDWLREEARKLYPEYESCEKVAYVIDLRHDWSVTDKWVYKVCRAADLIQATRYSDAVRERGQELAEAGLTARDVARQLREEFPEEGREDGPSYRWVLDNVDHQFARPYEFGDVRTIEYERLDGTVAEIDLRGRHDAETCRASIRDYEKGKALKTISERHGAPVKTIRGWTAAAGVRRTGSEAQHVRQIRRGKVSPAARRQIVEQRYTEERASISELAREFDVSENAIRQDLEALGIETRSQQIAMILAHWGSLQAYEDFCRDAYRMVCPKGLTKKAVCEKHDVCYPTVNKALKTWRKARSTGKNLEQLLS